MPTLDAESTSFLHLFCAMPFVSFLWCCCVVPCYRCCLVAAAQCVENRHRRKGKGKAIPHPIDTHRSEHAHTENNSHHTHKNGQGEEDTHSNKEKGVLLVCSHPVWVARVGCGAASVSPQRFALRRRRPYRLALTPHIILIVHLSLPLSPPLV